MQIYGPKQFKEINEEKWTLLDAVSDIFNASLKLIELISKESDDRKWVHYSDALKENIADIDKAIMWLKEAVDRGGAGKEICYPMNRIEDKTEVIVDMLNKSYQKMLLNENERLFLLFLKPALKILKMKIFLK